jgi:hypothetical protein
MFRMALVVVAALLVSQGARAQHTDSLFYGDTPVLLENPYGWGFIAGTNEYGDVGKYQRFDYVSFDNTYVVGVHVYFGFKSIVDYADTVWIVARGAGPDGIPGDLLEVIEIRTDELDTTGVGNVYYFHDPQLLEGLGFVADTIFLGVEWSPWDTTQSDTLALLCDPDGSGEGLQRVWENIFYNEAWTMWPWINSPDANFEWTLDSDLWIAALTNPTPPTSVGDQAGVPTDFMLSQNYPNPFNPSTSFEFRVRTKGLTTLKVFTVLGEEVATVFASEAEPGRLYRATFNAASLPSGLYFARLESGVDQMVRKMLLMK